MKALCVRVSSSLIERLDAEAADRQLTRSRLVRELLDAGLRHRPAPPPEPPSEDQLVAILVARARDDGNVSATKALLARVDQADPRERLLAEFERMAEERRQ